ncbi:MAG: putative choline kinase involved in biosynthesis [Planctomycetota bacterium]|nr:putative choline kinase involved in biosynthesis [Planctomycetota bacterium]
MAALAGGITNRNFRVRDDNGSFVARIAEELLILGVDRRNEHLCHLAAHALKVAPEIVFAENGVMVTRYIEGRTLDPAGMREPGVATRLAQSLRRLHEGWDCLSGEMLYFSPFQANRTYVETSRRIGAALPDDIDIMLEQTRKLSRTLTPFLPTLCHNDMLPANILDDGDRIWIVDWEYAGIGHPLFDLAGISVNCAFSVEQEVEFLTAYRGDFRTRDLYELHVLQVASLLREALWSVVQTVASDLDFDYRAYADRNFGYFREALRRLEPMGR